MSLEVRVERRLGPFSLRANFTSDAGITALFGRSGAGKTSLIRMIGGLSTPDRGTIRVNGRALFDKARRIDRPVHQRRIGYIFQESRLFPHLTARQNLLFGHWFTSRHKRRVDAGQIIELLGIGHLLQRRPALLSGGERQRIAIGRALLTSPELLLMDEPLASLDTSRKAEILPYIERLREELRIPIVYVSHSIEEVTRLAQSLVILSEGQIAAAGPLQQLMGRPELASVTGRYESGAVIEAQVRHHDEAYQLTRLEFSGGQLRVPRAALATHTQVRVRIRSRDVAIALAPPSDTSILNVMKARILRIHEEPGPYGELQLAVGDQMLLARITRQSVHDLGLHDGKIVYAMVKSIAIDHQSLGLPGESKPALQTPSA